MRYQKYSLFFNFFCLKTLNHFSFKKCAEQAYLYIVTVTAAIGYLIFYAIGLGPVSWVVVAELFDSHSSAKANCIISFFSWSFNFFITVSFPFLEVAKSY